MNLNDNTTLAGNLRLIETRVVFEFNKYNLVRRGKRQINRNKSCI